MGHAPEQRRDTRAQAIAHAVRAARERRGLSVRQLAAATLPAISPTTVSRIENPDTSGATGCPNVETLEMLAQALDCPLTELIGEPTRIEYRGLGDWPEALNDVMAERGGFVTAAERAFVEDLLVTIRETDRELGPDPVRERYGLPHVEDDPDYWREQLRNIFHESPVWRVVDGLVSDGWRLDRDAVTGLELVVRSMLATAAVPDVPAAAQPKTKPRRGQAKRKAKKKATTKKRRKGK